MRGKPFQWWCIYRYGYLKCSTKACWLVSSTDVQKHVKICQKIPVFSKTKKCSKHKFYKLAMSQFVGKQHPTSQYFSSIDVLCASQRAKPYGWFLLFVLKRMAIACLQIIEHISWHESYQQFIQWLNLQNRRFYAHQVFSKIINAKKSYKCNHSHELHIASSSISRSFSFPTCQIFTLHWWSKKAHPFSSTQVRVP